jgi:hypothetical protein
MCACTRAIGVELPGDVRDYSTAEVGPACERSQLCATAVRLHEAGNAVVLSAWEVGGPYRTRTYNQLIKSQLLYQLS